MGCVCVGRWERPELLSVGLEAGCYFINTVVLDTGRFW